MAKQDNTKIYLTAGIAALAYFGVIRPIFKKLGLAKGVEVKKIDEALNEKSENNPFKADYYKINGPKVPGGVWMSKTQTRLAQLYKDFDNAFGLLYDDEDKVKGVFSQLVSKLQVSQFSEYVLKTTGMDIITFMKRGKNSYNPASGLNDVEVADIIDMVSKKPIYTTK